MRVRLREKRNCTFLSARFFDQFDNIPFVRSNALLLLFTIAPLCSFVKSPCAITILRPPNWTAMSSMFGGVLGASKHIPY